jgi:hypothetical protein
VFSLRILIKKNKVLSPCLLVSVKVGDNVEQIGLGRIDYLFFERYGKDGKTYDSWLRAEDGRLLELVNSWEKFCLESVG